MNFVVVFTCGGLGLLMGLWIISTDGWQDFRADFRKKWLGK